MIYLILYGVGFVLMFALCEFLRVTSGDRDETAPGIAADVLIALAWPLVVIAAPTAFVYGYITQLVTNKGYPRSRRARRSR